MRAAAVPGLPLATYADFWSLLHTVHDLRLCARVIRFVAVCARVAWACYTAGGSDVPVQLPSILSILPPDLDPEPYVDLFDSESDVEGDMAAD